MKKIHRKWFRRLLILSLLLLVVAFPLTVSGEDPLLEEEGPLTEQETPADGGTTEKENIETEETEKEIPVEAIEVDTTETEVAVGETISLSGTIVPSDATEQKITYTSSDTSVAEVSSTGEVRGIKKGKAVITLAAGKVKKKVPVTVKVPTTSMELNSDYVILKKGETFQLSVSVLPRQADQNLDYTSADSGVVVVSASGKITAMGKGSTTVIVSNEDQSLPVSVIVNESVRYGKGDTEQKKSVSGKNESSS